MNYSHKLIGIIVMVISFFVVAFTDATELYIPSLEGKSGEVLQIPIMVDKIDNMAGIKLALEYDKNILSFQKGEKTQVTNSLMHIINDKNPGKLIIVMAGARGVEIVNQSIMNLFFVPNKVESSSTVSLKVTEIQMMSDKLQEIHPNIKMNPISVKPSPAIKGNDKKEETKTVEVLQAQPSSSDKTSSTATAQTITPVNK